MKQDPLESLSEELTKLEAAGLRRHTPPPVDPNALSFCSNDYLGLASRPAPPLPAGAGASRLIAGERDEHARLEKALAAWLEVEASLLFTSGYAANVGTLSAIARPGDLIVSDALNHASLIDGARLSRARIAIVAHNDAAAVARALADRTEARAWVVVESYYSMDADSPDLPALRRIADEHGAGLYVDEAHALGVFGPAGRGLAAESGVVPDVLIGTLGKSFGAQGAFAAGRSVLREYLWNRARAFVFSTGLAPASAAAALHSLKDIVERPDLGAHVLAMAARLRAGLTGDVIGHGHVVPVVVGSPTRALELASRIREEGIAVQAIRPPTVPVGTARIRFTVTARHQPEDIDRAIAAFANATSTPLA